MTHYQSLYEKTISQNGSLDKDRREMPQIEDKKEFKKHLEGEGIDVSKEKVDPKKLKPAQNEYDSEKVDGMVKNDTPEDRRVIVSRDGDILDGHHTAKATSKRGKKQKVYRADTDIDTLYDKANKFTKSK